MSSILKTKNKRSTILNSLSWENTVNTPISLSDAKAWLKMEEDDDNAIITALIDEVIDLAEREYNFTIVDKTVTAVYESFGNRIHLLMAPVKTVTSIKLIDSEGEETTLTNTEDYHYKGNTVYISKGSANLLEIVYTAGWDSLPSGILLGLKKMILSAYEDRQDVAGMSVELIPGNSRQIFKRYRRFAW